MDTIKVGGVPEHFNLPWHLAIEEGSFSKQKVNLKWKDFKGGTGAMLEALDNGEIDLAVILTEGAVKNIVQNRDKKILATFVNSPLRWGIFTQPEKKLLESQVFNQTYAISREGSGSHLMAQVHALQHNKDPENLSFKIVHSLDGAREAFRNDSAQVFFWEYLTTKFLVENGEFEQISIFSAPWPAFVIVTKKDNTITSEQTEKVLSVLFDSIKQLLKREDRVDLISQRYNMDKNDVVSWLKHTQWSTDGSIDNSKLKEVIEKLKQANLVGNFESSIDFTR